MILHWQYPAIALPLATQGWAGGRLVLVQHCHGRTRQCVCPEIRELRNRASALMAVTAGMVKAVSICIWTVLIWIKNARAPCAKHQLVSAHSDNSDCTGLTHYRACLTPSRFSTAKPAHRGNRNVLWVITRKRDHVPHLISAKHVLLRDPVIHGSSVNSHGFTAQEVSREKATGPGNSQGFMEIEGKRNHYSKLLSYNNNFCKILFESIN